MQNRFTKAENEILSEIYRRLNYFHKGNLDANLLYLGLPSEASKISKYNLIKPYSGETPRVLNWYTLTDKGKKFFANYLTKKKLDQSVNHKIFTGAFVKEFDKKLLSEA